MGAGCTPCVVWAQPWHPPRVPACPQDRLQRELANTAAVHEACRQLQVQLRAGLLPGLDSLTASLLPAAACCCRAAAALPPRCCDFGSLCVQACCRSLLGMLLPRTVAVQVEGLQELQDLMNCIILSEHVYKVNKYFIIFY